MRRAEWPSQDLEQQLIAAGDRLVCGVDEAGRGPLAGPVVAAAVVLPGGVGLPGVTDSKRMTEKGRERAYALITDLAVCWAVGEASAGEIDTLNILGATFLAMRRAVAGLGSSPDHVLVDGPWPIRGLSVRQTPVVRGDQSDLCIAAASVVAKVTRDRIMVALDSEWPAYGFARHKGYGTPQHLAAIRTHGPSCVHRLSFANAGGGLLGQAEGGDG